MRRPLVLLALVVSALGVLVVAPRSASAQVSIWLQKGVSGFGVSGSVGYGNKVTTVGVDGGYSYQGFLDFDLGLEYINFPTEQQAASDQKTFGVTPSIQYHPLKQGPDMPVSVSVGVAYEKVFFSSDMLSNADISVDSWGVNLNAAVYRFFRLGESTGVIPAAGLAFTHGETTFSGPGGELTGSSDDLSVALGAYFAYIDDGGRIYGLVPSVTIGDHVTVGLQFGVVWSQL